MDAYDEMLVNLKTLRRCRRYYNLFSIIYIAMCALYASLSFVVILMGICDSFIFMLIDGIAVKAILMCCGYMSCYKHRTIYAMWSLVIQGLSVMVSEFISLGIFGAADYFIFGAALVMSLVLMVINPKYQYLEQQPGFPYFNELMEEDKFNRQQQKIKNFYEQKYEEYLRTQTDEMDLLDDDDDIEPIGGLEE